MHFTNDTITKSSTDLHCLLEIPPSGVPLLFGRGIFMAQITLNDVKYFTIHNYLRNNFKKKNKCDHCGTTEKRRYEWALIKGREYSRSLTDYFELCVPCHRIYDVSEKMRENSRIQGAKLKGENNPRAKLVLNMENGIYYGTSKMAADSLGIKRTTLCMMLTGKNRNRTPLKYV